MTKFAAVVSSLCVLALLRTGHARPNPSDEEEVIRTVNGGPPDLLSVYETLRSERCIWLGDRKANGYVIFVRTVQNEKLLDLTIKRGDGLGKYDLVIRAREGKIRLSGATRTLLIQLTHGEACSVPDGSRCYFESKVIELPLSAGEKWPLYDR